MVNQSKVKNITKIIVFQSSKSISKFQFTQGHGSKESGALTWDAGVITKYLAFGSVEKSNISITASYILRKENLEPDWESCK